MSNELENEVEELDGGTHSRRAFFGRVAAMSLGAAVLGVTTSSDVVQALPPANANNAQQFRRRLLAAGTVSLMTSQIALNKATATDVRRFAQFETSEQIATARVLKEMGTVPAPMDAQDRAIVNRLRNLPRGAAFDRAYATAQNQAHIMLRDLCNSYLRNSSSSSSRPQEMHARHIAMLALPAIIEHISHTQRLINGQML